MASTLGDSYCSLAWGAKLVAESSPEVAAGVLRGSDEGLSESDAALARWARKVTRDPNATDEMDVQTLRDVGFSDRQIFAITAFISFRIAFSTVNDALGAQPDRELVDRSSEPIREVVTYGRRPISET
jgi:alkylhydroperoxidase family enzyme